MRTGERTSPSGTRPTHDVPVREPPGPPHPARGRSDRQPGDRRGFAVHTELGPGLLEEAYESFLLAELVQRGLTVQLQVQVPATYEGKRIPLGLRLDLLVEGSVVVEVKAADQVHPRHRAVLRTYLVMSGAPLGLLFNYGAHRLKDGIVRDVGPRITR